MLFLSEKYARKLRKVKYERIALIKNIETTSHLARQFALLTATIIPWLGRDRSWEIRMPVPTLPHESVE